jgi:putative hemolysin
MGIGLSILLAFVLILVNGYFSMSEMALVNASKPLLDHEAEEGDKAAARAANLASDSGNFLATIQVAITLVGFFSSAVASTNLSDPLAQWLSSFGIGWLSAAAPVLSPILITLAVSYFSIVLGELVPKRMALADTEKIAKAVAGPLIFFGKIATPLVWLTSVSANFVARVFHIKQADEGAVSEEEIKYMVAEQEDLSEDEKRMIHEVFDLGDAVVREVMVPRVDVTACDEQDSISQVLALMQKTGFSRLPVYRGDMDEVAGIVNIKDLIDPALSGKGDDPVAGFARPCMFVPETKDLLPLLAELRAEHAAMAIVVDEYGGTAGVITIEDIVEEVVGEINDEYDDVEEELTCLNEREWEVDGTFSVDDALELGWPIEDSEEYDTVAGWFIYEIDRMPEAGDVLERDGWEFRVTSMDGLRIESVHVTAPEEARQSEEA